MSIIKWGIAGPGTIADKFALATRDVDNAELVAIGSRSKHSLAQFGARHDVPTGYQFSDYESLVSCPEIDAVYIANLHPAHASTAILAMQAGKHVLCEKPAAMTATQVISITEAATENKVLFMEAFMYLCHPQMQRVVDILSSNELGAPQSVDATFGFYETPDDGSRLFAHDLGGGGILDVGCYPVSFARRIAGFTQQVDFAEPATINASGKLYQTGVDEYAEATLEFANGFSASCRCAITKELPNTAVVQCENGSLELLTPWLPGDGNKPADASIQITVNGEKRIEHVASPAHHYSYEVDHACKTISAGQTQASLPGMSHAGSIGNARVLDEWRHQIGYTVQGE